MRSIAVATVLATGMLTMAAASANGGEELARGSGCLNCHAIDAKKIGPAYKDVAKKFKGKSREDATAAMKAVPVHTSIKVSDKDLKEIVEWILKL